MVAQLLGELAGGHGLQGHLELVRAEKLGVAALQVFADGLAAVAAVLVEQLHGGLGQAHFIQRLVHQGLGLLRIIAVVFGQIGLGLGGVAEGNAVVDIGDILAGDEVGDGGGVGDLGHLSAVHAIVQGLAELGVAQDGIVGADAVDAHAGGSGGPDGDDAGIVAVLLQVAGGQRGGVQGAGFKQLHSRAAVRHHGEAHARQGDVVLQGIVGVAHAAVLGAGGPGGEHEGAGGHEPLGGGAVVGLGLGGVHAAVVERLVHGDGGGAGEAVLHLAHGDGLLQGDLEGVVFHNLHAHVLPGDGGVAREVGLGVLDVDVGFLQHGGAAVDQLGVKEHLQGVGEVLGGQRLAVGPLHIILDLYLPDVAVLVHLHGIALGVLAHNTVAFAVLPGDDAVQRAADHLQEGAGGAELVVVGAEGIQIVGGDQLQGAGAQVVCHGCGNKTQQQGQSQKKRQCLFHVRNLLDRLYHNPRASYWTWLSLSRTLPSASMVAPVMIRS